MYTGLFPELVGINLAGEMSEFNMDSTSSRTCTAETTNDFKFNWEEDLSTMFESSEENRNEEQRCNGRERIRNFLRRIRGSLKGQRLIHDIVPTETYTRSEELLFGILKYKFFGGLFIWVYHDDHTHVIHDCSWNGRFCRCRRFQGLRYKRHKRITRRITELSYQAIFNLTKYLLEPPRRVLHFEYAGRVRSIPSEIRIIPYEELSEHSEEFLVEGSDDSNEFHYSQSCRSPENASGSSFTGRYKTNQNCSRLKSGNKKEELLQFLWDNAVCPILNITNTNLWINSKYRYVSRSNEDFKAVCHIFNLQVCQKAYFELCENLMNGSPLFYAYLTPFEDLYFDLNDSINIVTELLTYQVGEQNIATFLLDLYNILDKRIPKVNCMFILGEPNSGKNFLFDSIIASCVVSGQIGNFNKFNNFPLMECVNKRILLWNEPNCEPNAFDTLKMLFGGDSLSVRVKYEADAVVLRTPIIVLSNTNPFPNDSAFGSRMIRYTWRSAPFLKSYDKKIHPLTIYNLLNIWNIN